VSSSDELELLRADVHYCHDRLSLLRAKLYRWGLGSNTRLRELERSLELAEQPLRDHLVREHRLRELGSRKRGLSEQ
jgi:hypothetical protein